MKNRILTITRNIIPYVKELRPIAGSVAACIVMQQLDFWFNDKPDGFYKFLEPCGNRYCKAGDTWTEELGMTADEFRTAFDKIGTRYTSKTAFNAAPDQFKGKFYCSYADKKEGTTHYFRNHELVDAALDSICEKAAAVVTGKSQLLEPAEASPINGKSQTCKPALPISYKEAEINAEITQKQQQDDVDFSRENIEPENTLAEDSLKADLRKLGISARGADTEITAHRENARRVVAHLAANPGKMPDTPGGVVLMIRDPQGWGIPSSNAAPQAPAAAPKKPPKRSTNRSTRVFKKPLTKARAVASVTCYFIAMTKSRRR